MCQITQTYNISEIWQLQSIQPGEIGPLGYCGITYAYITSFPLDSSAEKLFGLKWSVYLLKIFLLAAKTN